MVILEMFRHQREYTEIVGRRAWTRDLAVRSILGSRVTLAGTGDIGQEAALRLRAFRPASLTGVNRRGRNPGGLFDRIVTADHLSDVLPETDILIVSLPGTRETARLLDAERLALLPDQAYRNTASFWSRCNKILIQYIAFDLLDGMIIGLCNWVFMVVAGMPYVAIISVVVGVTNLAPTFGPMIGAVIGAFILVLVKPWYALLFLIFTLILQTLDGYVIKPRLFGEQLGVSAVWILISLVIGGRLLGVPGILLAIPFAAIVDFVYQDYVIKWLETQNEEHKKGKHGTLSGIKAAGDIAVSTTADLAELAAMVVTEAADLISSAADDDEGVYSEADAPAESPREDIGAGEKTASADPSKDDIGAGEKAAPADPPKDDIDAGEKAAYEESPAEEIGAGEKAAPAVSSAEEIDAGKVIETAESAAGDAGAEAAADAPVPAAASLKNSDRTEKQNHF